MKRSCGSKLSPLPAPVIRRQPFAGPRLVVAQVATLHGGSGVIPADKQPTQEGNTSCSAHPNDTGDDQMATATQQGGVPQQDRAITILDYAGTPVTT
jgi:hypothetical protein